MNLTDKNNVYVLLAENDATGEAQPIQCTATGEIKVYASSEVVTPTIPNKLQDDNNVPIARVVDENGDISYLHIGALGTLLVQT
jgi:hypothetical protein